MIQRTSLLLCALLAHSTLSGAIWVDEKVLKDNIKKNPLDIQSRLIYARWLMDQNETAKARILFENINTENHVGAENIKKEFQQYDEDMKLLKTFKLSTPKDQEEFLPKVTLMSPKEAENIYRILIRFNIPITSTFLKELYNQIDKGPNVILARTIALSLPSGQTVETEVGKVTEEVKTQEKVEILPQTINDALEQYRQNPTYPNVQNVVAFYTTAREEQKKIDFLKNHCRINPFDSQSKIELARYLSWEGKNTEALVYLNGISGENHLEALLISGQIESWNGNYELANTSLNEVLRYGTPKQRYDAEKSLAYIARWRGDNGTASSLFAELHREDPSDSEVSEEVMIDQKNFTPLIQQYEKMAEGNPKALERLVYLLQLAGKSEKALFYLEKQYKLTNNNLLLMEMGNIAISMKQTQKGLLYWKQYATAMNTPIAWLGYGKNLYWAAEYENAIAVLKPIAMEPDVKVEADELIQTMQRVLEERQAVSSDIVVSDSIQSSGNDKIEVAEGQYREGKLNSAGSEYRLLYIRTGNIEYAKRYIQILEESGKTEEAEAIKKTFDFIAESAPSKIEEEPLHSNDQPLRADSEIKRDLIVEGGGKLTTGMVVEHLKDNAGVSVSSVNLIGSYTTEKQIEFKSKVGEYRFKNSTDSLKGESGFVSVGNEAFEAGAFIDNIEGSAEVNPYLRFTHVTGPHSISLIGYRRNVGFIKNSIIPLQQKNTLTTIQVTDYALFPDQNELWASFDVSRDEKENTIFTPQFQYRFFQIPVMEALWSWSVDGWYLANTHPTSDYYSPKREDGTYASTNFSLPLWNKFELNIMGGLGYSFQNNIYLYKAGGWISRTINDGLSLRIGCSDHSSISNGKSFVPYAYDMCDAGIYYRW